MPKLIRCLPPARWGPREADSQCIDNIASFRCMSSNFIKLDYLYRYSRNPTHPIPKLTLFSHLPAEDPGPSILSAVAILPDLDGFLQISSKLDYLYRFSRNPTPTMPISTFCLLPARWGPRALDSQYSGNIARFWWISSNFVKTQLSIQMLLSSDPTTPEFTLCLPPARWGPREADPSTVAILPVFDVFLPI